VCLLSLLPRLAAAHDEPPDEQADASPSSPTVPAEEGEAVVVVHGPLPPAQTASRTTVTARQIEAVPIRTAEDALKLTPGITLVQHGSEGKGQQFFLRGFDAVHGMDFEVTLDGIPLNEWSNVHGQGYLDLSFIIPETIAGIGVTKGPFYDQQGAFAMAGSADYRLGISEDDRGLRGNYTVGTTNRHRLMLSYSPRHGDGRDFVAAEVVHDEGYGENRSISRGSVLGRVRLLDSPRKGTLSLLGSAYFADFELPGTVRNEDVETGTLGFYDTYDHASHGQSGRGLLALQYEQHRARHHVRAQVYAGYRDLELLENYTGFLIDPVHGDRRRQEQQTLSYGAMLHDAVELGPRWAVDFGASVRGDALRQQQTHVDQKQVEIGTERSLQGLQALSSLHASLRARPLDNLNLSAGGRLDMVDVYAQDRLDPAASETGLLFAASPRLTADFHVLEPVWLYLAYGRGFRPPEARAFTSYQPPRTGISEELYDGGEPSITRSHAAELGVRLIPSRYLSAVASGFATFIAHEAVFDHVSGLNLELNRTRRLGGELDLRSSPTSWLLLLADITAVDARFVESGNPVPFAPWLSGSFSAIVTHGAGFRAGLRLFALAPRPLPHGARGAPLAKLDATLGYHWPHVHLDLAVENLLNQHLREGEYHYASDWTQDNSSSALPVLHTAAGPPLNGRLGVTVIY